MLRSLLLLAILATALAACAATPGGTPPPAQPTTAPAAEIAPTSVPTAQPTTVQEPIVQGGESITEGDMFLVTVPDGQIEMIVITRKSDGRLAADVVDPRLTSLVGIRDGGTIQVQSHAYWWVGQGGERIMYVIFDPYGNARLVAGEGVEMSRVNELITAP